MCNPTSRHFLQPAIRRTPSGTLDTEHYHRRARAERAEFLRALLVRIAGCLAQPWRCLRKILETGRRRRELAVLSSRELKDIGLTSSDITAVANGLYQHDWTRRQRVAKVRP